MHVIFLCILLAEASVEVFTLFFFFGTNKWLSFLSYFWAFKSFLFETGYLELSRVGKIDFMRWEKSVVKSILLESKTLLSRMFCLYHNNTFLLFQPGPWGLREQESFFASYHLTLVGLLEVKPMKVKPMNLLEVTPTKYGGLYPPRVFSLIY